MQPNIKNILIHRIRICIWIMVIGLFVSGVTAFPIETELKWLSANTGSGIWANWLITVYHAVENVNARYPYLSYGTDWLAFAHLLLAILFAGTLKDPLRNIWIVQFGIIASIGIFPLAFIAGEIRGIPVFWRLIDCSFGVVGLALLIPCYVMIKKFDDLKNMF